MHLNCGTPFCLFPRCTTLCQYHTIRTHASTRPAPASMCPDAFLFTSPLCPAGPRTPRCRACPPSPSSRRRGARAEPRPRLPAPGVAGPGSQAPLASRSELRQGRGAAIAGPARTGSGGRGGGEVAPPSSARGRLSSAQT